MPRLLEIAVFVVAAGVAVLAILVGADFARPLVAHVAAGLQGEPWRVTELASLMVAFFGPTLLGVFVLAGIAWHLVSSGAIRRRRAMFPQQPWLWRADWAAKVVRLSNHAAIGITVASLAFYGLVIVPLGIYLASLKQAGMVYGFLAVLGAFLLVFMRLLWLNRRWSRSSLHLDTLPGTIGGTLCATLRLAEPFPAGTGFRVDLRCDITRSTRVTSAGHEDAGDIAMGLERGTGTRSTLHTHTMHESPLQLTVDAAGAQPGATVLPMVFHIPGALPPTGRVLPAPGDTTSSTRTAEQCDWRVRIRLDREGDPREVVFEVPVFAVPGASRPLPPSRSDKV